LRDRLKSYYDGIGPDESGEWPCFEDTQLIICPPRVQGYALEKKSWVQMLVDRVKVIKETKDETAFSRLLLPDDPKGEVKTLIQSLVQYHASASMDKRTGVPGQLRDLVEGKGQGLVILLHGEYDRSLNQIL
jgi:hypothetical protein